MTIQVKKYTVYEGKLKWLLVWSGLWPGEPKQAPSLRYFLRFLAGFFTAGICYGTLHFSLHYASNIILFSRGMSIFLGFSLVLLKICVMTIYQKELGVFDKTVSTRFRQNLAESDNEPHLLHYFRIISNFFYYFYYILMVNNVVMTVIPLMQIRHGKYLRMHPQHFPFTYQPGGVIHWCIYAFEITSCFFLWTITCGVDSFFGYQTLHMVGELRLLTTKFRNLKVGEKYKKELKTLVDKHVELIRAQRILEQVFGYLVIWLAVTSAISLCVIIFQFTKLQGIGLLRTVFLINYSIIKNLQAFSYSWFGNIICTESKACLHALYETHWPGLGDSRIMNDVLIVLSQKPLAFNAKGFFTLDINMFAGIVNTAVSYFFLLQTLEENYDLS